MSDSASARHGIATMAVLVMVAGVGALLGAVPAGAAPLPPRAVPTVIDPRTSAGVGSVATAINDRGEVAGTYFAPGMSGVFVWSAADGVRSLGLSGAEPIDVNESGQIIGWLPVPGLPPVGFVYRDGVTTPTPGFLPLYQNDRGQVLGAERIVDGAAVGIILWEGGVRTDLSALIPGYVRGVGTGINNEGQLIAAFRRADGSTHGGIYRNAQWRDLGGLGPYTWPNDINEAGDVVGVSGTAAGAGRPFRWRAGQLTDLGSPGVLPGGSAVAVNDSGQVLIGTPGFHDGGAYLWTDGVTTRIADDDTEAIGLNNDGVVIGTRAFGGQGFAWRDESFSALVGYAATSPLDLNEHGQIVGQALVTDAPTVAQQAALWNLSPSS
ncbi:hypothetical protein MXD61_20560 [Frankia sp. AgPm24]|uniref:hypothetical protein n=1 Tax=Frankia sp. AgPm24 TaxID=631128 RepID=UPI00200D30CE|nr:hypothetical protein [Frankia sp. AgPm24]MCK9924228.1 hypothetical protein [Frankia sp. AgPm24]